MICDCPVILEGKLEEDIRRQEIRIAGDPAYAAMLKERGILSNKEHLAENPAWGRHRNPSTRPWRTQTRPASGWIQCRTGHIRPLIEHARVCPKGTTPHDVILAFMNHASRRGFSPSMVRDLLPVARRWAPELVKSVLSREDRAVDRPIYPGAAVFRADIWARKRGISALRVWNKLKKVGPEHRTQGNWYRMSDTVRLAQIFWRAGLELPAFSKAKGVKTIDEIHHS